MRHFLIFYSYRQIPTNIKFASFVLEADSFPTKQYLSTKSQENSERFSGNSKFLAVTGIIEVNLAEVSSYVD